MSSRRIVVQNKCRYKVIIRRVRFSNYSFVFLKCQKTILNQDRARASYKFAFLHDVLFHDFPDLLAS